MPTGNHNRPTAIGVLRQRDDDTVADWRARQVELVRAGDSIGFLVMYVFRVIGDRSVDVRAYADAEDLAKDLDAAAFIVTPGIDRRVLQAIADRVRMVVHVVGE